MTKKTTTTTKNSLLGLSIMVCISTFFYQGCNWDNEEDLYPPVVSCDTTIYNYADGVAPILSSSCLSCHANNVADENGGSIRLGTYADVKTNVDNGKIVGAINHKSGFSPMPKGAAKLDACKIAIIEKWISEGALNN